jgi:hypothetical protein
MAGMKVADLDNKKDYWRVEKLVQRVETTAVQMA